MTYPRTEYLAWASANHGRASFNLATSGVPEVSLAEVATGTGSPIPPLDDGDAFARLREAIAVRHGVAESRVALALGGSHGIWLTCAAVLAAGDEVLVEHPVYEPLVLVPRAMGATVRHVPRNAAAGFALDPERVLAEVTPRTKLVAVSNLHNPTGVRTEVRVLRELARSLARGGVVLMVDEVYAPFDEFLDSRGELAGSAHGENIVVVSSLTKTFGTGPNRIGWLIADEAMIRKVNFALTANIGLLPVEMASAGAYLFEHIEWLAARSRRVIGDKRERARAWVASHGLRWSNPSSGLFGLASGLPLAGEALDAAIARGLRDESVIVSPGTFFGVPDGIRLAWSCADEQFDEGLVRLARVLGLRAS